MHPLSQSLIFLIFLILLIFATISSFAKMDQALSIPEISRHICQFIRPSDYGSCALVSRAWFDSIVPWIWHSVIIHRGWGKNFDVLYKYRTLVRTLNLGGSSLPTKIYGLFDHLKSLHFEHNDYEPTSQQNVADLIRRNQSSLQSIRVHGYCDDKSIVFGAFLKLPLLRHLHYNNLKLQETVFMKSFMNICTRLVTLRLENVEFAEGVNLMLKDQQFTSLKKLKIEGVHGSYMDFLRACPNLEALSVYQLFDASVEEFVEVITTHCKQLTAFSYYHQGFENVGVFERLALILPPMKCLQVVFLDGFSFLPPSSYSRHYQTLQAIHMANLSRNDGKEVQTILSSCPNLRWFCGDFVFAENIASGSPWVCQRLEHLQLEILVCHNDRHLDSAACAQLSQLRKLRTLNMSMASLVTRTYHQHRSLSLKLGEGLELLASLLQLEHLGVGCLRPEWREEWRTEDIEWMAQAWPNLEAIYGRHGKQDEMYLRMSKKMGVSRVLKAFPNTDYIDLIDL